MSGGTSSRPLDTSPRPADNQFVLMVEAELASARAKFPSTNLAMVALTEEVGELAQALLKWRAGKKAWVEVVDEAIQVAAMAQRVAVEGDPSFSAVPYSEPGK